MWKTGMYTKIMARNKKLRGRAKSKKTTSKVNINLDAETAAIWNHQKQFRNMSEWVRMQMRFHFRRDIPPYEEKQLLQEEYRILAEEYSEKKKRLKEEYDARMAAIGKELQKKMEALEENPEIAIEEET